NARSDRFESRHAEEAVPHLNDRRLQGMLVSMRTADRDRDGVLHPKELQEILNKYHVTVTPGQMLTLKEKFTDRRYPGMVKYESFVQFLLLSKNMASLPKDSRLKAAQEVGMASREETKLIAELGRFLPTGKQLDLDKFRRILYEMDRNRNEILSKPQVEYVLERQTWGLPGEVQDQLLRCSEKSPNTVSIPRLMDLLERARPKDSYSSTQSVALGENYKPRPVREPQAPPHQERDGYREMIVIEEEQEPVEEGQMYAQEEEEYEEPVMLPKFDRNRWMNDFQSMANALLTASEDGYMTHDEIRHFSSTFNLVYNLEIPEELMELSLSQSLILDPHTHQQVIHIQTFNYNLQQACIEAWQL
ncbi:unnamed protein product, partial [Darwinula stevensoni]